MQLGIARSESGLPGHELGAMPDPSPHPTCCGRLRRLPPAGSAVAALAGTALCVLFLSAMRVG